MNRSVSSRPTYAEVSLSTIQENYRQLKQIAGGAKVCAVVKADAYGHGMVPVAKALEEIDADYFVVALVEEGVTLREAGISTPILVLGGLDTDQIEMYLDHNLTITASSLFKLQAIEETANRLGKKACVHLKIDTGMGRIGVHWERAQEFLKYAKTTTGIEYQGIYSHFADTESQEFMKLQFDRFMSVLDQATTLGLSFPIRHISKSMSMIQHPEYHLDMVRPGIVLYGIEPEVHHRILPESIKSALSWKTRVVYFKTVAEGESVGYGRTWKPKHPYERVVTLPIGYADGFVREFSNCGIVLIRGKRYSIIGRVCMDQMMVSVGPDGEAYVGDTVTLIGIDGNETLTAQELARILDTTPHAITTLISQRVPRVYRTD